MMRRILATLGLGMLFGTAMACASEEPDNDDACPWARDGVCDAPSLCPLGTDTFDCALVGEAASTCPWTNDGECDEPNLCAPGTDVADCGGEGTSTTSGGGTTDECQNDSDCASDEECRSGSCYELECTSDSHCGSCERCSDNVCRYCGEGPYGCYC